MKNGPTENPWRTQVWPLSESYGSLYHAIGAMTKFLTARFDPSLRIEAVDHMKKSFRLLAEGLSDRSLPLEVALACTLGLTWAEAWDRSTTTGIAHLRGATTMLRELIALHRQKNRQMSPLLQFLFNNWLYLNICTKLTSETGEDRVLEEMGVDEDDYKETAFVGRIPLFSSMNSIDPLICCAQTLFPLVGQVATLARRVRKMFDNNILVLAEAAGLKQSLENWVLNITSSVQLDDPDCDIQSCLSTAEAYRFAALLHLHQTVPELPSLGSRKLSLKVTRFLASIPAQSRTCVVHIFPLLIAGCEASTASERKWVTERWAILSQFMWVGNIDRTIEVVKEVWKRKDGRERARDSAVRDWSHWSSVMKSWGREVFLG